jgi:serpin B
MIQRLREWFGRWLTHDSARFLDDGTPAGTSPELDSPQAAGPASSGFVLALHQRLRTPRKNLVFSPFSMRAALAMAGIGARGRTLEEMRAALPGPLPRFNGIDALAVANALWVATNEPLLPSFVDAVCRDHGAEANGFDPARADAAVRAINAWVRDHTRGRIPHLVDALGENTAMVLVNAVAFYAKWHMPFDRQWTEHARFWREDGTSSHVHLMRQQLTTRYTEDAQCQVLALAYAYRALSFIAILPRRRDGLVDLEASLTPAGLDRRLARLEYREVLVWLPRVSIASRPQGLAGHLGALGMPAAFSRDHADFSGINGITPPDDRALYVSDVAHEATIDVDEAGTEATAATSIQVARASPPRFRRPKPVPVFRADHPFLFAIRHEGSGELLFFGRVADPERRD